MKANGKTITRTVSCTHPSLFVSSLLYLEKSGLDYLAGLLACSQPVSSPDRWILYSLDLSKCSGVYSDL